MKKTIMLFAVALCAAASFAASKIRPFDAVVGESFVNPVGFNLEDLSFSWKIPPARDGLKQSAYQIVIAETAEKLDTNPIWDSGKVESSQSLKIPYSGRALNSRERLYWRVRIWDELGECSQWSEPSFFETGLLSNSDWSAKWITSALEPREIARVKQIGSKDKIIVQKGLPPVYLRREISAADDILSARLYVASRGIFQFYINGKKVGDDYWGTGWTDYKKRIQTNTYDVKKMLLEDSKNTLSAIVSAGWFAGQNGWAHGYKQYGSVPELIAQLEIIYKDGKKEVFITDANWKAGFGGLTYADIYAGEEFDATKEPAGWKENKFDDSAWDKASAKDLAAAPLLEPRRNTPITEQSILYPLSVREVATGTFVFDMGQNMVGVPQIKIPADPSRKIKIRYAEMLNPDGTLYTDNYRSARSTDYYTCSGYSMEQWRPTFTYHGFRYIELSGFPASVKPSLDWVRGIVLHNKMRQIGSFVCSSQKINKLQSCIQWGQRGNFFSVPTDCPQRDERLGWTGDAQVFAPTAAFNMDVSAFFAKWTLDLRDTQEPDGRVPSIAPALWKSGSSPAWSDAVATIPWELYQAYGDVKILRKNYPAMKAWADYMAKNSQALIQPAIGYGDWLQPNSKKGLSGETPKDLIGTAYFARVADIVSQAAAVLGDKIESEKYSDLASDVKMAFVKKYVKPDGRVEGDCQTAYLLTLAFDILPESSRAATFARLLKVLERDKWHLNTGFVGTPLLNEVLTRFGRADIAYRLINTQTYPSWLYPINQGATTMWERWNSFSHEKGFGDVSMNSFNHYAYGAIGQWLYKNVAGLWYDAAGYKNIIFAPKLGGDLTFASATHETPYGLASSGWKISDGVMEWAITIPPNATGTIVFPSQKTSGIRLNGRRIPESSFVDSNGFPSLENMPSGKYIILLRL